MEHAAATEKACSHGHCLNHKPKFIAEKKRQDISHRLGKSSERHCGKRMKRVWRDTYETCGLCLSERRTARLKYELCLCCGYLTEEDDDEEP